MKDTVGFFIVILGAYIFQVGFNMLSDEAQKKFSEKFAESISTFIKT